MKRYYDGEITHLKEHEIFVFGSNEQGIHGAGAALTARQRFGAIEGQGWGPQGHCFAIPTRTLVGSSKAGFGVDIRTLTLGHICNSVNAFLDYTRMHPDFDFLVTPIGCGYAGYVPQQIATMFIGAPCNVILPCVFWQWLEGRKVLGE